MSLFTAYQPAGTNDENREPYVYQPNVYPFAHIHATTHVDPMPASAAQMHNQKRASNRKRNESAYKLAFRQPEIPVRPLAGPLTKQTLGHGPFHPSTARPEQKRLNFSKPTRNEGRPMSELDERAQANATPGNINELPPADTIRLFTSTLRKIQEAAVQARSYRSTAPNYVQAEQNQPLSSHAEVMLERYQPPREVAGAPPTSTQPQVSASYIQRQTQYRLETKAEQLAEYHRNVQQRLNRKVIEAKREEQKRREQLPGKVKRLVYDMNSNSETPLGEGEEEKNDAQSARGAEADHGLARMDLLPYHESAAPPASVVQAWSEPLQVRAADGSLPATARSLGSARSRTAAASTKRSASREKQRALMSKEETKEYLKLVRKQEMERSRQNAQQARMNQSASAGNLHSSRRGRSKERVAFGAAVSRTPSPSSQTPPRPTPRGLICRAEERDDRHRNPHSFAVRQTTAEQEAPEPADPVLHVPHPGLAAAAAQSKKARMSAAVAGRKLKSKKRAAGESGAGGAATSEKNSAYRRLVLERLHAVSANLNHPLPPLCACGFTPKDEYELLFSYGGVQPGGSVASAPQQPQPGQMPFNLSTLVSQQPLAPSIHAPHSHTHAQSLAQLQQAATALPAHVSVDSTRHGFQHKHNCQFYGNAEQYVKAMANLLHTLEDQQQI